MLLPVRQFPPSDHLGLFLEVSVKGLPRRYKSKQRRVWRYSLADFDLGCDVLDSVNWDSLLASDDINSNWEAWLKKFMEIMEACIPTDTVHSKKSSLAD